MKQVKGLESALKDGCYFCIHKKNLQVGGVTSDQVRCCHAKVMEIQERFSERKPGLTAAKALNQMGKELNPRINPAAYTSRWFYWPHCYNPIFVDSCWGFERTV